MQTLCIAQSQAETEMVTGIVVLGILASLVALIVFFRTRAQMHERQLGVIRALASEGRISRDEL